MDLQEYFDSPQYRHQKQYEAVRAFVYEKRPADEVAKKFGYTKTTIYSMARDFRKRLAQGRLDQHLFAAPKLGRNKKANSSQIEDKIITLRKKYFSVEEIKEYLDSQGAAVSESYIYKEIKKAGFARLPRRTNLAKKDIKANVKIEAPKAVVLNGENEAFNSSNVGLLCFAPLIKSYAIDQLSCAKVI